MADVQEMKTGGDLVAETLKAAGVDRVFALHGGHHEALFKGCHERNIELIDFRHEAAAGHAADAFARLTGKLGVCIITAGPGFTNAISAITNAKLDNSPVLFIIAAPPLREIETNPLQGGIDQIAMARPTAKWALSIPSTERIPDLTAMAIRRALAGTLGPVVLELPIDVLHMSVPADRATLPAGVNVAPRPAPSASQVKALAELISEAERPILIAGQEAANGHTAEAVRAFADATGVPVFQMFEARGVLPLDHPSNCGGAGNLGTLRMMEVPAPDLVVLLGGRMGMTLGGRSGLVVPDAAKLAQIHTDATEIGRIRDVDLAICADAFESLQELNSALEGQPKRDFTDYCDLARIAGSALDQMFPESAVSDNGINPYHAAKAVCAAAGTDAVYILDGGEAASWGGDCAKVSGPNQILGHGYLGCLGIGPGFSIGAQIAFPTKRVVQITGDGAMGFHIQEFDTMVRRGLPIVTVILNNRVWGMSIHGQQIMFGANYNLITQLGDTSYTDVASGFGVHAERVEAIEEIGPAMARAFASGKPALVEILTDPKVVHPITKAMLGQVELGSNDVMIPYYENIPAND